MAKIVRILYREKPLMQPAGDMCAYDKLYDMRLDNGNPTLRAGSKSFDITQDDFDDFIGLCEQINAVKRILENHPWKMMTRFDAVGALGSYIIVFDDGNAACADFGPQEIPQRFKELEKKYTPASEPVCEGAWVCSECGRANTGKYCCECGAKAAKSQE